MEPFLTIFNPSCGARAAIAKSDRTAGSISTIIGAKKTDKVPTMVIPIINIKTSSPRIRTFVSIFSADTKVNASRSDSCWRYFNAFSILCLSANGFDVSLSSFCQKSISCVAWKLPFLPFSQGISWNSLKVSGLYSNCDCFWGERRGVKFWSPVLEVAGAFAHFSHLNAPLRLGSWVNTGASSVTVSWVLLPSDELICNNVKPKSLAFIRMRFFDLPLKILK